MRQIKAFVRSVSVDKVVKALEAAGVPGVLDKVGPEGFSGDACFTGGCGRSIRRNGCGGMKEDTLVF